MSGKLKIEIRESEKQLLKLLRHEQEPLALIKNTDYLLVKNQTSRDRESFGDTNWWASNHSIKMALENIVLAG
jgi:hypothetical protein